MAKLTVLKNHKIGDAVYLKDDTIEVSPDEAIVLLDQHKQVFEAADFDPDDPQDAVGSRYQLYIDRKLKIEGKLGAE